VDEPDIEYLIKEITKTADPFWVAEAISAEQADAAARSVAAAGLRRAQTAHPPSPPARSPKGATVPGGQLSGTAAPEALAGVLPSRSERQQGWC
jgi:hypothetical protein